MPVDNLEKGDKVKLEIEKEIKETEVVKDPKTGEVVEKLYYLEDYRFNEEGRVEKRDNKSDKKIGEFSMSRWIPLEGASVEPRNH